MMIAAVSSTRTKQSNACRSSQSSDQRRPFDWWTEYKQRQRDKQQRERSLSMVKDLLRKS